MPKTSKKAPSKAAKSAHQPINHSHEFTEDDIQLIRENLLRWYDINKRSLPWRAYATEQDANIRAYAVWVSEIMLQQTQVATVVDYYNRWMKNWPSLEALARASLEEVNECWSGLGYYSRARRLHEAAIKVVNELDGKIPTNAAKLQKELPGVGLYTAGAIASIAFGEATGVVDGNVIRVLSRLRRIGADMTSNTTMDHFWSLAHRLVPNDRPGDFNQAMMEFGATLCTPKTPQCSKCVLRSSCQAHSQVEDFKDKFTKRITGERISACDQDIEDCSLCLPPSEPWNPEIGVCNYPMKPKKKEAREEVFTVLIVQEECNEDDSGNFLLVQRPESGLLAGLWEFPNLEKEKINEDDVSALAKEYGLENVKKRNNVGELIHKFSHRHHKYVVELFSCKKVNTTETNASGQPMKWVNPEELDSSAISTAMKKVFKLYQSSQAKDMNGKASKKRKRIEADGTYKQMCMESFFKVK
ncbi:predicted protein [Nematostella vectensis]|uniref:Adenine DNA glycosylase n=1 Tax=Nematostella vectensis TaxID=45351 RepID=A7RIG3_NEMVE|nr:adenine DNA glycosylase [Nematostella vectensis]EDO48701.1 predicted protein [Nematostella vectensis]|eukprot:XP_001640764.1 predicted protein [Nematostella vectensis]